MKIKDKNLILFENNKKIFAQAMLEAGKEKTEKTLKDIKDENDKNDDFQTSIRLPAKKQL
jgi:hypothetical protein